MSLYLSRTSANGQSVPSLAMYCTHRVEHKIEKVVPIFFQICVLKLVRFSDGCRKALRTFSYSHRRKGELRTADTPQKRGNRFDKRRKTSSMIRAVSFATLCTV